MNSNTIFLYKMGHVIFQFLDDKKYWNFTYEFFV